MAFELAEQDWNEEGWGPKGHNPFFSEVVYAPFSKGDKLGRVADWAGQINAGRERAYTTGIVNQNFGFLEDDTFQLVDNTKSKPSFTKTQQRQPFKGGNRPPPPQKNLQKLGSTKAKPAKARSFKPRQNWGTQTKTRDPSIEVKANWQVLEEIDFVRLAKTSFSPPSTVTDLKFCGSLFHYDRNYDRITTRTEKPLANVKKVYGRVSASNDPILKEFADSGEGNVFATDSIIALLMSSTRSVLPWDIVVTRVGEQLFFDKRNASQIDLDTVNETAPENQNEGGETVNNEALSMEASEAAQSFVQQVLKKAEIHKFQDPSPFEDDSSPHKAYRYRKFVLDEGVSLVLRTEIDGFIKQSSTAFINLRSLIEYDPKQGPSKWRAKLDSQRGATFANELKNNSNKIARWTAEALLSGVDHIKLGFVSRINPKSSEKHSLLATQVLKPVEFANQINFNLSNAWGIVKSIVDYFLGLPEGKYLLAKDANKSMMRIYRVPEEDVADQEEEIRDDE